MDKEYINGFLSGIPGSFSKVMVLVGFVFVFASCASTKSGQYFRTLKRDTTITGFISNDFESRIKPGDILSIVATSLSKEEDVIFNQAAGEFTGTSTTSTAPGFLVKPDGTVLLHKLGAVKAAGVTRKELATKIQQDLLPFMKDPIVNVNYLNHKVTVMGAVRDPQVITFPEEQLPLIDVLIKSGDLMPNGKLNDILIIRGEDSTKKVKHINLEDHSIFTSPWYYVKPDDIVYVVPDKAKEDAEERRRRLQTTLSLAVSGISLIIIILDRIIK